MSKKFQNKKLLSIAFCIIFMTWLTGCSSTPKTSTSSNDSTTVETTDTPKAAEAPQQKTVKTVDPNAYVPKFQKSSLPSNTKPTFATAWKNSPNGAFSACIEGKGPDEGPIGGEEGIGKIYLKDSKGNEWSYSMVENSTKQYTPKYLEFWNNTNLFVIVGYGYGTVSVGGNVYNLDLNTGIVSTVYDTKDKKRQVVSMSKTASGLTMKINVYEDDNYLKSHYENLELSAKTIDIK